MEKSMRKAKKNIGSKDDLEGLEKAYKRGDFTKKKGLLSVLSDSMTNLHLKISAQNSPNAVNPDLVRCDRTLLEWRASHSSEDAGAPMKPDLTGNVRRGSGRRERKDRNTWNRCVRNTWSMRTHLDVGGTPKRRF
ncbi:hypothetical protein PIB30_029271 [Stylosanthes scabra]|uniref:Uncharacterized protein n=1 Tax=Stylosanthes scabra TaxID=79078 RepID=A0ABU6VCT9_9FABA|nr:hypothetical protein [Stylosanthes scabra]